MKHKVLLELAFKTLFWSWGGDTPPEAIWAANDFLNWIKEEYNIQIDKEFEEDDGEGHNATLIKEIMNKL